MRLGFLLGPPVLTMEEQYKHRRATGPSFATLIFSFSLLVTAWNSRTCTDYAGLRQGSLG